MALEIATKRCSTCGEDVPVASFGRDRHRRDGLTLSCRDCLRAYAEQRRRSRGVRPRTKRYASRVEWRRAHPERGLAYARRWRERNPLATHIFSANSRARRLGVEGRLRVADLATLVYECAFCGRNDEQLELDHKVPFKRGGLNVLGNVRFLCVRCNFMKADRTDEELVDWCRAFIARLS